MNNKLLIPQPRQPLNRSFYLPRLPRPYYQGDAVVHWTLTVFDRATGWLTSKYHATFRQLMLHAAAREGLACPIYCLMPDHVHLVWMGLGSDSDQLNSMAFLRTYLRQEMAPAKFQPQAHDEVLKPRQRRRNAFAGICRYIALNPMRAELIDRPEGWPFTGCVVLGYPSLNPLADDYWLTFWKIFQQLRRPDAGNVIRPPIA
jgi:putative transposase